MQINVSFDQNQSSLPSGFVTAVNYVVSYFDTLFTNNVTLNIHVGYGEIDGQSLASNALGESYAPQYPPRELQLGGGCAAGAGGSGRRDSAVQFSGLG